MSDYQKASEDAKKFIEHLPDGAYYRPNPNEEKGTFGLDAVVKVKDDVLFLQTLFMAGEYVSHTWCWHGQTNGDELCLRVDKAEDFDATAFIEAAMTSEGENFDTRETQTSSD